MAAEIHEDQAGASAAASAAEKRARANQLLAEAEAWEKGARGEVLTATLLSGLRELGWVVRHDLGLPRSKANVDHLLIGPGGVLTIDTKNFSGRVNRGDGTLWHNKKPMRRELAAAVRHSVAVADVLGLNSPDADVVVWTVFCIHGASLPDPWFTVGDVSVVDSATLVRWIKSLPVLLTPQRVAELADVAASQLHPRHNGNVTASTADIRISPPGPPADVPRTVVTKRGRTVRAARQKTNSRPGRRRRQESLAPAVIAAAVLFFVSFTGPGKRILNSVLTSVSKSAAHAFTTSTTASSVPAISPPAILTTFTCPAGHRGYDLTITWPSGSYLQQQMNGGWLTVVVPPMHTWGLTKVSPGQTISFRSGATAAIAASAPVTSATAPTAPC